MEDKFSKSIEELTELKNNYNESVDDKCYMIEKLEIEKEELIERIHEESEKNLDLLSQTSELEDNPYLLKNLKNKISNLEKTITKMKKTYIPRNGSEALSLLYAEN